MSKSTSRNAGRPTNGVIKAEKVDGIEELDKLEAVVARVKKIVSEAPYFLTVPQDEPRYNHHSRQDADAWMSGYEELFDTDEEHVQYATYLYREQGDDCFVCRTAVDEDRERKAKLGKVANHDRKSFLQGSSNKKVSLGSYLGKSINGASIARSSANKNSSEDSSRPIEGRESAKAELTDRHTAENGIGHDAKHLSNQVSNVIERKTSSKAAMASNGSVKRARADAAHDNKINHDSPPSPKRLKTTPSRQAPPAPRISSKPKDPTPHNLPPLLSPINKYDLPPLLSPTLPPNIQRALDELSDNSRHRTVSDASNSSDASRAPPMAKPNELRSPRAETSIKVAVEPDHIEGSTLSRKTLIVKLKFKKRRKELESLLKFTPAMELMRKRSRERSADKTQELDQGAKMTEEVSAKSKDRQNRPTETRLLQSTTSGGSNSKLKTAAEKRTRPLEQPATTAPPLKRHKHNASVDLDRNPKTPIQAATSSPSTSNLSTAQKGSHYLTPKKDNKAVSMLRTSSDPGFEDSPGQSSLTPVSSSTKLSDARNGPTSVPHAVPPEVKAWNDRSRDFNSLGRKLKHEADPCLDLKREFSLTARKTAAVKSLESLLAYMAAFAAADYADLARGRSNPVSGHWSSLLPMWLRFQALCRKFPFLEALRLRLGVIMITRTMQLHSQQAEAYHRNNDKKRAEDAQKKHMDESNRLFKTCQAARHALSLRQIEESFPKLWAGQSKELEPPEWETSLKPGDLDLKGMYCIHVGVGTTALQVIRFASRYLKEWTSEEKDLHDYKMTSFS